MNKRVKDETGAYAVLFGLLVVVLVSIAALAVDIGNAVSRKSDVQGQADIAALAGARELGAKKTGTVPAAVVDAVRDYLNGNHPLNQDCTDDCVTSAQLTNGALRDGEVRFANGGLQVHTPFERVDYGFARVMGINDIDVQAHATVKVVSPGGGTLPMYAAQGCDFGPQTLTDPANGQIDPVTPTNLAFPSHTNNTNITAITSPNPPQIPVQDPAGPGPLLRLSGSGFVDAGSGPNREHVTRIGFFLEDGITYHEVAIAPGSTDSSVEITAIPEAVASAEGVWWVRVFKEKVENPVAGEGRWSPTGESKALRVGSAVLECDAGSVSGNFGTLRLARHDVNATADDLPVNIAESFEDPLSLAIHEGADFTGLCTPGIVGAVGPEDPSPGLNPGTNCVATDPGLPAGAATSGLVTGLDTSIGHVDGRLDAPTNSACGSNMSLELGNQTYSLNNDTLSCFLTNGLTLSSIVSGTYAGPAALSEDLYLSPRFFWLPILAVEPNTGTSLNYSIVDFRPGFITDESLSSSQGSSDRSATNGLRINQTNVIQVKVIFFDVDALPVGTPGPNTDYLGVGPKNIRLID